MILITLFSILLQFCLYVYWEENGVRLLLFASLKYSYLSNKKQYLLPQVENKKFAQVFQIFSLNIFLTDEFETTENFVRVHQFEVHSTNLFVYWWMPMRMKKKVSNNYMDQFIRQHFKLSIIIKKCDAVRENFCAHLWKFWMLCWRKMKLFSTCWRVFWKFLRNTKYLFCVLVRHTSFFFFIGCFPSY